jgi:DNA-binding ferritin-like protein
MGEFILTLLHAVTNTHILHFRANTNAVHEQLGEFYTNLSDLVDKLAEAMQGRTNKKLEFPVQYYPPAATPMEELMMLRDYVDEERNGQDIPQNSEIQNLIDEIAAQIDSTINKLENYK